MTGSEGLLGIIVEVTVKLLPKPECAKLIMASFDKVEKAGVAVGNIIAAGIVPGGLEMMDNAATRATEDFVHAGYDVDAAAILLCEVDGTPEEVEDEIHREFEREVPSRVIGRKVMEKLRLLDEVAYILYES